MNTPATIPTIKKTPTKKNREPLGQHYELQPNGRTFFADYSEHPVQRTKRCIIPKKKTKVQRSIVLSGVVKGDLHVLDYFANYYHICEARLANQNLFECEIRTPENKLKENGERGGSNGKSRRRLTKRITSFRNELRNVALSEFFTTMTADDVLRSVLVLDGLFIHSNEACMASPNLQVAEMTGPQKSVRCLKNCSIFASSEEMDQRLLLKHNGRKWSRVLVM